MTSTKDKSDSNQLISAEGLTAALQHFAELRDWDQFHSPKNLVMALTGETGELTEIFQWMTESESKVVMRDPKAAEQVRHEIADVLLYLVRLADVLGVDLDAAAREKLAINAAKYPASTAKGKSTKYNQL